MKILETSKELKTASKKTLNDIKKIDDVLKENYLTTSQDVRDIMNSFNITCEVIYKEVKRKMTVRNNNILRRCC